MLFIRLLPMFLINIYRRFVFKSNHVESLAEQMLKYKDAQLIDRHKKSTREIFSKYSSDSLSKHLVDILKIWMSKK